LKTVLSKELDIVTIRGLETPNLETLSQPGKIFVWHIQNIASDLRDSQASRLTAHWSACCQDFP